MKFVTSNFLFDGTEYSTLNDCPLYRNQECTVHASLPSLGVSGDVSKTLVKPVFLVKVERVTFSEMTITLKNASPLVIFQL